MSLDDRLSYYKIPGLSIAIIDNDEIVYVKSYGSKDIESKPLNLASSLIPLNLINN